MSADKSDIASVVAFAAGVGVLSLATPVAIEALVTTAGSGQMMQQLVTLTGILFVCLSFAAAMRAIKTYLVEIIQQRIFARVTAELTDRLPRVRAEAFDGAHGPELVTASSMY